MNTVPNNVDWSATAAWIALAISITGTILGPIITTILTNRHQLKLRQMDITQKVIEKCEERRFLAINTFIAKAGCCLSCVDEESVKDFGESYHCIYQYVPDKFWPKLDEFYMVLISYNWKSAKELYPEIIHELAELLRGTPQYNP